MSNQIGRPSDGKSLRDRIQKALEETTEIHKNCSNDLKEYQNQPADNGMSKDKDEKVKIFQETQANMLKQFTSLAKDIRDK
jgi:gas vesicle protein